MKHPGRRAFCLIAAAGLANCSSPDPTLYTLQPLPGTVLLGGPRAVELRRITVAHYLERDQIVRSAAEFKISTASNDWWAEPISAMLARTIQANLAQRLPNTQVLLESGSITAGASVPRLEINLSRLDRGEAGSVVLDAQMAIAGEAGDPVSHSEHITVPTGADTVLAQVAASSQALARLCDRIAARISRRG
jgi:uncharacterized lipoprotein YmbA